MRWVLCVAALQACKAYGVSRRRLGGGVVALSGLAGGARPSTAVEEKADLVLLEAGLGDLDGLLSQWKERTTNCKYAEVNRELLSAGNKQELLAASSENALIAKNGKAVKTLCKRDPEVVRLVLGLDGKMNKKSAPMLAPAANREARLDAEDRKAPLADADRMIRRQLKTFDGDLEAYVDAEERWLRAIATVDSSTYASGVADFGATVSTGGSNADSALLDAAKAAALDARNALQDIVRLLKAAPP